MSRLFALNICVLQNCCPSDPLIQTHYLKDSSMIVNSAWECLPTHIYVLVHVLLLIILFLLKPPEVMTENGLGGHIVRFVALLGFRIMRFVALCGLSHIRFDAL